MCACVCVHTRAQCSLILYVCQDGGNDVFWLAKCLSLDKSKTRASQGISQTRKPRFAFVDVPATNCFVVSLFFSSYSADCKHCLPFVSRDELLTDTMNTPKRSRKRYLEPGAWNDPLPRSTLHDIRKRTLSSTEPDPSVNSDAPTTVDRPATPVNCHGSERAEDCSDNSFSSFMEAESAASDLQDDCEFESAESTSAQPPNGSASSSFFRMEFRRPIGNGSKLSVGDALVLAMDFAIKHGLAWTAIEDLLKYSNNLLGTDALPDSKYLFRKFSGTSPEEMNFFFYCPVCHRLLAKTGGRLEERNGMSGMCCGKRHTGRQLSQKGCFFVSLPLKKQFASVLAVDTVRQELYKFVSGRKDTENENSAVTDITDGAFYKKQRQKLGCQKHDLTMTVNADGSPVFKSSNYSIWPVHLTINELPPHVRWSNVICALLWYGTKHPDMTLLLQAFMQQMKELSTEGIHWSHNGEQLHSKVYCITGVADAPARASMQNVLQFNGYYGCSWCLHPGEFIEGEVLSLFMCAM